jgi:hypothetical protein
VSADAPAPAFDAGNGPAQDGGPRGDGRGRRGRRRGRRGGGRNRDSGQPNTIGGESQPGGDFAGAREASDEEREFHAQMTNGNRGGSEHSEPAHQEAARDSSAGPSEREPPREQRNEGTQAPLDLPPPPPTKPFVVWSSSPSDAPPVTRRDE